MNVVHSKRGSVSLCDIRGLLLWHFACAVLFVAFKREKIVATIGPVLASAS